LYALLYPTWRSAGAREGSASDVNTTCGTSALRSAGAREGSASDVNTTCGTSAFAIYDFNIVFMMSLLARG
jgi:hypothetical protein